MRSPIPSQSLAAIDTDDSLREENPHVAARRSQVVETRVVTGLHCIDDMRARGWRLLSLTGEKGFDPIAVMRKP